MIGWGLLVVDHSSGVSEEILRVAFVLAKGNSLVGVESSGEVVTIYDSEHSGIDVEVDSNVEMSPGVVLALIIGQWQLVSFQENSLGHSRILNLRFKDVDGVIVEEIVDSALAGSEVFVGVLHNWLDEVGIKDQDL